jgi:transposase
MPRFKHYDYSQTKMLPISFDRQILPGSFEYTLDYLVEHELDLGIFDHRYCNDEGGRPAYDPRILLKVVILAYSKGITSSRKIEALCRDNILFMALSADSQPHFTTIAEFISSSHEEIAALFQQILLVCDACGLIGKEMFAIDGCKLPSNASKEWSGTHGDLNKKRKKIDRAIRRMLENHKTCDQHDLDDTVLEREQQQIKSLRKASRKIKQFLATSEEKAGHSNKPIKSNITDNDSAKMRTSHGVIQGYNGVAAVDDKHQIVLAAEAYGQAQEHGLLEPMIEQTHEALRHLKRSERSILHTKITADSGYHNNTALQYLDDNKLDAYIADKGFRSRDPRFKDYDRFKPADRLKSGKKFTTDEFSYNLKQKTCCCPAGKAMWLESAKVKIDHHYFMRFRAYEKDCPDCPLRGQCLRKSNQKSPRVVNINLGVTREHKISLIEKMKQKIDSPKGRHHYSKRLGIVEPVFGNINTTLGINRFSLRGKPKVNGQWQLMTMIHNILKIHRYGWEWA